MESTRESQRVSHRVGKLSRFKADLNNLSLCSSFGLSAKKVFGIRGSREVLLENLLSLGRIRKRKRRVPERLS